MEALKINNIETYYIELYKTNYTLQMVDSTFPFITGPNQANII